MGEKKRFLVVTKEQMVPDFSYPIYTLACLVSWSPMQRQLASLVVFLYDYCLTFGTEYKLIWPTNISVTKLLFIVVRYVPFADLTIVLWHQWKPRMSINECDLAYRSTAFLFITGIITAEVVLAMRTWAVWAQDKFVGYFLIVWVLLTTIPNFTLLGLLAKGLSFIPLDVPWTGCFISSGNPLLLSLCWVLLMIMEAGTLTLMFIKGYQNFRMQGRTPLFNAVYRDGSLFYVYLFAFSVINVSVIFTVPNGLFLLSRKVAKVYV
ncbi:hypothetical protein PNOK_0439600 [Pyrrhoderma noxium]|uniref:DUF6533 domain-containing protein n=1 Tax=Pyrrhoderma noxium TaxID=2282107 RepID=A0A286UIP4_9AGAM|nr:hypothetical protein PNOK_0439600 [Pyrrhoderma noxium]